MNTTKWPAVKQNTLLGIRLYNASVSQSGWRVYSKYGRKPSAGSSGNSSKEERKDSSTFECFLTMPDVSMSLHVRAILRRSGEQSPHDGPPAARTRKFTVRAVAKIITSWPWQERLSNSWKILIPHKTVQDLIRGAVSSFKGVRSVEKPATEEPSGQRFLEWVVQHPG